MLSERRQGKTVLVPEKSEDKRCHVRFCVMRCRKAGLISYQCPGSFSGGSGFLYRTLGRADMRDDTTNSAMI